MESLLYIEKFEQNYNCSFYDFNSIPVEKRQNVFAGILLLIFYFAFEILYLPCLGVFARRENRRESCYKLMLFMGLLSMVNIHSSGLIIGIYAARGDVFCSRPLFNYIIGMFAYGFFCSESLMAVILALNRCLEMWDHRIAENLFEKHKVYYWILGAFAYGMFSGFTAIPPTPNGAMLGWFWNPHIPYFVEDPQGAYRGLHFTVHNITIGFGLPLIYAIFYLFMRKKMNLVDGEHQSVEIRKSKKNVFIQVMLIGILHMFVTQLYVYMQYFPVPIWMVMSVSFAWIASQGLIPVIYIVFNKNIRRSIRSHFIGPILSGITSRIVQNQQQPNSHPQMNSVQPMPSIFSILADKNDAIPKEKNGVAKNANVAISTALI